MPINYDTKGLEGCFVIEMPSKFPSKKIVVRHNFRDYVMQYVLMGYKHLIAFQNQSHHESGVKISVQILFD